MFTANFTACLLVNYSKNDYAVFEIVGTASSALGLLASLVATALILLSKAYRVFILRLMLYLAGSALLSSLCTLTTSVVVLINFNYFKSLIVLRLITAYSLLVYYLFLCWIALYIFSLALCSVQLKKAVHEVIGLVFVLIFPLASVWSVPVYGENMECVLNIKYVIALTGLFLPVCCCSLIASLAIISVLVSICKMSHSSSDALQRSSRRALIETIPILIFILIQSIASALLAMSYMAVFLEEEMKIADEFALRLTGKLFSLTYLAIPVLLLCQYRIRQNLKCKKSFHPTVQNSTFQHRTVHQSSAQVPSHTHFSVPTEVSCTEQDPLIKWTAGQDILVYTSINFVL